MESKKQTIVKTTNIFIKEENTNNRNEEKIKNQMHKTKYIKEIWFQPNYNKKNNAKKQGGKGNNTNSIRYNKHPLREHIQRR